MTWAILVYIAIFTIYSLASLVDDFRTRSTYNLVSDSLSLIFIYYFTASYLLDLSYVFIFAIIPMLLIGIPLEILSANREISHYRENPDPELTPNQNKILLNFALVLTNLITVPGYVLGMYLVAQAVI